MDYAPLMCLLVLGFLIVLPSLVRYLWPLLLSCCLVVSCELYLVSLQCLNYLLFCPISTILVCSETRRLILISILLFIQ